MFSRTSLSAMLVLGILQCFGGSAVAGGQHESADVVFQWNQLLQDGLPPAANPLTPRAYAMLHIAQFDAVNSIERRFAKYHVRKRASGGASSQAAAAQAAHDVLVALLPANAATYEAALAGNLAGIPSGRAAKGRAVGKAVARAILAWRANDGSATPPSPYVLPVLPGLWQPTPGNALFTQLSDMTPFALLTTTQYLPARFPELTSTHYADDFEEVKLLGSATSTVRTAEQTQLARLVAGVTSRTSIVAAWNNVARDVAATEGLSLLEAARVFALLNVAMQDGLLTTMTSKFVYGLWRPQTAIRGADGDLNPDTFADTGWTSLLGNPPYPSYAGNVACIGASAARALALGFGSDAQSFTVVWRGNTVGGVTNPDVPMAYTSLWRFAEDNADSRIYGGIHYRFDHDASQEVCPKIAEFAFATRMRPVRDDDHDDEDDDD